MAWGFAPRDDADDTLESGSDELGLPGVIEDFAMTGSTAIDLLVDRLANVGVDGTFARRVQMIEGRWVGEDQLLDRSHDT